MLDSAKTKLGTDGENGTLEVLLVDDDPGFLDITTRYFESKEHGIDIITCESPEKALKILEDTTIDCVLCDYQMPEMNGIELLEEIRQRYPDLPFILITSKGSEEVASEAISKGVTDYIQKKSGLEHYNMVAERVKDAVRSK